MWVTDRLRISSLSYAPVYSCPASLRGLGRVWWPSVLCPTSSGHFLGKQPERKVTICNCKTRTDCWLCEDFLHEGGLEHVWGAWPQDGCLERNNQIKGVLGVCVELMFLCRLTLCRDHCPVGSPGRCWRGELVETMGSKNCTYSFPGLALPLSVPTSASCMSPGMSRAWTRI